MFKKLRSNKLSKKWILYIGSLIIGLMLLPAAAQSGSRIGEKYGEWKYGHINGPEVNLKSRNLKRYLESYGSPLAPYAEEIIKLEHWKLLIAISRIESQFCKRVAQSGMASSHNCFGIGGDYAYRWYGGYMEAFIDANELINKWQAKGKWLTVESMNCSYVVPCNPNWVNTVNKTLKELEDI